MNGDYSDIIPAMSKIPDGTGPDGTFGIYVITDGPLTGWFAAVFEETDDVVAVCPHPQYAADAAVGCNMRRINEQMEKDPRVAKLVEEMRQRAIEEGICETGDETLNDIIPPSIRKRYKGMDN